MILKKPKKHTHTQKKDRKKKSLLRFLKQLQGTRPHLSMPDMVTAQMNLALVGETFKELPEIAKPSEGSSALLCPPSENLHLISQ